MGHFVIVEPGDHLPQLAEEAGFGDWHTVWEAAENADLRARRPDPGLLAPGDRVFIPDKQPGDGVQVPSGAVARFRVKARLPKLRLVLCGFDGKPFADAACTLAIDGAQTQLTSGTDGLIALSCAAGARDATLTVDGRSWQLRIGHLDPIDTDRGVWARLRNLGYLVDEDSEAAAPPPDAAPEPELLRFAIALFQRDHGLPVDGSDVAAIRTKLAEAHGC